MGTQYQEPVEPSATKGPDGAYASKCRPHGKETAHGLRHDIYRTVDVVLDRVVVQAPRDSGALITAHAAVEQGREVFAVPGEAGVNASAGPHALIREGAKLVESAEDIIVELNLPAIQRQPAVQTANVAASQRAETAAAPSTPARPAAAPSQPRAPAPQPVVADTEREVLSVLTADGSFVDEIAAACRVSIAEALSTLTYLELKGLVRQYSGKRFAPR